MKQTILAIALALSLAAGTAFAHPMHSTAEGDQTWQGSPGMMMGKGAGMRGHWGQGQGMTGKHGYRRGMMGNYGQCIAGWGMHGTGLTGGHHWMMDPGQIEKRDVFLDETKGLRKKIHDKHFEYMEASRNPEETLASLREREKELSTLQQELQTKREEFFTKK